VFTSENRTKKNSVPSQFGYSNNETQATANGSQIAKSDYRLNPKDAIVQTSTLKASQSSDCLRDATSTKSHRYHNKYSDVEDNYSQYSHSHNGPTSAVNNNRTSSRVVHSQPGSVANESSTSSYQTDQRSLSARGNNNVHLQADITPSNIYAKGNGLPSIVVSEQPNSFSKHDKQDREVQRSNNKKHSHHSSTSTEARGRPIAVARETESSRGANSGSNSSAPSYHSRDDSSASSSSDVGGGAFFFFGLGDNGSGQTDTASSAARTEFNPKRGAVSQRTNDKRTSKDSSYTYLPPSGKAEDGRVLSKQETPRNMMQVMPPATAVDVSLLSTSAPPSRAPGEDHYSDAQLYIMNRRSRRKGLVNQQDVFSNQEVDSCAHQHGNHRSRQPYDQQQPNHTSHFPDYSNSQQQRQERGSKANDSNSRRYSDGLVMNYDSSHHVTSSSRQQQQLKDQGHYKGQSPLGSGLTSSQSSNDIAGSSGSTRYPTTNATLFVPNNSSKNNNNHPKPPAEGLWVTKLNV
jgi:hypothetical protein